jgi:hypothetical protein
MKATVPIQLTIHGVVQKYDSREDFEQNRLSDAEVVQDRVIEVQVPKELFDQYKAGSMTAEDFLHQLEGLKCQS